MKDLPAGRMPSVGMRELVAAIHRRRTRRREAAAELGRALKELARSVEEHMQRIAQVRDAIQKQGGDLANLKVYDNTMAQLRAQLRAAERAMAEAYRAGN